MWTGDAARAQSFGIFFSILQSMPLPHPLMVPNTYEQVGAPEQVLRREPAAMDDACSRIPSSSRIAVIWAWWDWSSYSRVDRAVGVRWSHARRPPSGEQRVKPELLDTGVRRAGCARPTVARHPPLQSKCGVFGDVVNGK